MTVAHRRRSSAVVRRVSKAGLMARLLRLVHRLPGRRRGLTLYCGRHVVVTTPRGREELAVRHRVLPLLVPPGAVDDLRQRAIEDEAAPPATVASERPARTSPDRRAIPEGGTRHDHRESRLACRR